MDKSQGIDYILSSKLSPLLKKASITDVSYNGESIFVVDNHHGRTKSDIPFPQEEARDFIRQIANICEKQFSVSSPRLDVTLGPYRVNAMHQSIGRVNNEEAVTFAIRIASDRIRIYDDEKFLTPELKELFDVLVTSRQSIVIGGLPGTGKTEFQKYLLTRLPKDQRAIVVDNILELETIRKYIDYDLTMWQYNENNQNATLSLLIKEALRNIPDWLILAEGRGKEMLDILNSAVTGLPIITTLHAFDCQSIPTRMAHMVMLNEDSSRYEGIMSDISYHFRYLVYLKKDKDSTGGIRRYISSIIHIDPKGKSKEIYSDDLNRKKYSKIDRESLLLLKIKKNQTAFIKSFVGDSHE